MSHISTITEKYLKKIINVTYSISVVAKPQWLLVRKVSSASFGLVDCIESLRDFEFLMTHRDYFSLHHHSSFYKEPLNVTLWSVTEPHDPYSWGLASFPLLNMFKAIEERRNKSLFQNMKNNFKTKMMKTFVGG